MTEVQNEKKPNIFQRIFKLRERKASVKTEIIGGLITFVAMCYILPVNSSILSAMGMSQMGVFAMTAFVSCLVTLIMGLVANYPLVLSAGMGLNAYITYTIALGQGYDWHQAMILLTVAGLIFFVFSLTPVRKLIIEAIPKNIQFIISAALGAFICFVGLRNSGIITGGATLVELNTFANPAVLIALVTTLVCLGLMFAKKKIISNLAIPICIVLAAVIGLVVSIVMTNTGALVYNNPEAVANGVTGWAYQVKGNWTSSTLPIAPWDPNSGAQWGLNGADEVLFFGLLKDSYSANQFGSDIVKVLTTPASYLAIFSLCFVNLFDTTATLLTVGHSTGIIDENGKIQNYRKAVLADATGAAICGPLGTSTVTSFAESNVGIEMGAKTGLSATVAALMFLASAFIYPIFSIFTAGSVTAPALICVGALIFVNNLKELNFKEDPIIGFVAFVTIIFSILTYSISSGIGLGLLAYCVIMLIAGKGKEVKLPIYIICGLFIVSFVLTAIM